MITNTEEASHRRREEEVLRQSPCSFHVTCESCTNSSGCGFCVDTEKREGFCDNIANGNECQGTDGAAIYAVHPSMCPDVDTYLEEDDADDNVQLTKPQVAGLSTTSSPLGFCA